MPQLAKLNDCGFDQIVTVSARRGDNMDTLLELISGAMPQGPKYFPDDMMTDQPERILCAEIIREKALNNLRDEVPHGIGVDMLKIAKVRDGLYEMHADVYCDRASHKSIIIGKQGAMLRKSAPRPASISKSSWARRWICGCGSRCGRAGGIGLLICAPWATRTNNPCASLPARW